MSEDKGNNTSTDSFTRAVNNEQQTQQPSKADTVPEMIKEDHPELKPRPKGMDSADIADRIAHNKRWQAQFNAHKPKQSKTHSNKATDKVAEIFNQIKQQGRNQDRDRGR